MNDKMPGLTQQRIDRLTNNYCNGNSSNASSFLSSDGVWSKHRDDISYNQLQKFWIELPPQARQELLKIDKQTLFEQARKNMYCSRCNGLLLEGFIQIVMYGKSQQQGAGATDKSEAFKNKKDSDCLSNGSQDEMQNPSIHPWGGLTTTRDGSLTLLDCYLYGKSLKGLQNVFDSARARERERELLYPDACGGGGRGWMSQRIANYGRGHGTRETCALHTARLSCDTLVDFWSALGEETRHSLLRMKEDDFIERLMYRFDSKRFCRDCRKNVIREFKELKELKRLHREPHCTGSFCGADTAFQYEVSHDTVQADWRQTFADCAGSYHHFEWAVGTGEGKSDILEFENVGMNGSVQVNGLDLRGLSACFITLRAWKLDGRCTELSVKAHALKGSQRCVHCRLVVGDGYVSITRGENIRSFFEHAEEAEEEEDDDSMDKDESDPDGECSRPQRHAKSPELAREFLLDAATVIFKEQVEKAFREGTARQNAHSIFVCLALKLLEERVHVAFKEIITLEKQMKLLEEEEREKREEEERKERRRTKEREKKQRRKERIKGKERDKGKSGPESDIISFESEATTEEPRIDEEAGTNLTCGDSARERVNTYSSRPGSPNTPNEDAPLTEQSDSYYGPDEDIATMKDEAGFYTVEESELTRRGQKCYKNGLVEQNIRCSDRRQYSAISDNGSVTSGSELRYHGNNSETLSRIGNGINRQVRVNGPKSSLRSSGLKSEHLSSGKNWTNDRYENYDCNCNQNNKYRVKVQPHVSVIRSGRECKPMGKSEPTLDIFKQFSHGNRYSQTEHFNEISGRPKSRALSGNNKGSHNSKKVWEPLGLQKYPRSNSDSDLNMRRSGFKEDSLKSDKSCINSFTDAYSNESSRDASDVNCEDENIRSSLGKDTVSLSVRPVEEKDFCCSKESAKESAQGYTTKISSLALAHESSTSISDNCSSCLSEGDSHTASSNNSNTESSSTSDSEETSQLSEGQENSSCSQNGFTRCDDNVVDKKQSRNGEESFGNKMSFGLPLDGVMSRLHGDQLAPTPKQYDSGKATLNIGSQPHGIPQVNNSEIPLPMLQAAPVGYYPPPPVSWPTAPASGFLPFTPQSHYVYAGPLGYGLNGNSNYCMRYDPWHNIGNPLFSPAQLPIYQPATETNNMILEKKTQNFQSGTGLQQADGANVEKAVAGTPRPMVAQSRREVNVNDCSSELQDDDAGFSLFHFGCPIALSKKNKSDPDLSKDEIIGNFSSKISPNAEGGHTCNKKDSIVEEYSLFAASNGIKFSLF